MSDTEKLVEIELDVPLQTLTKDGRKEYFGKVKVTKDVADDLKRREHEYHQYERSLIRNNGRSVEAGSIVGGTGE